jgi:hypothetical protein
MSRLAQHAPPAERKQKKVLDRDGLGKYTKVNCPLLSAARFFSYVLLSRVLSRVLTVLVPTSNLLSSSLFSLSSLLFALCPLLSLFPDLFSLRFALALQILFIHPHALLFPTFAPFLYHESALRPLLSTLRSPFSSMGSLLSLISALYSVFSLHFLL